MMVFSLVLGLIVPLDNRFDLVELNHLYSQDGQHQFDQIIFWSTRYNYDEPYQVADCWVLKHTIKGIVWGEKSVTFYHNGLCKVSFKNFKETWTQEDPEYVNRAEYPNVERRTLQKN